MNLIVDHPTFFLSIGEVSSSWFEQISQPVSHEYLGYG